MPMVQIIRAALRDPLDRTRFSLIYANVFYDDIFLKDELDELVQSHSSRLKVLYVLNDPPLHWNGAVGFISKEHINKCLPRTKDVVLLCGRYLVAVALLWII